MAIAMAATEDAGYRNVAKSNLAKKNTAEYLLALPRVQQSIAAKFEAKGCGLGSCATVLSDIMHGRIEGTTVSERLRAIDLVFKATTGYATTKTATVNTTVPPDQFFSAEAFAQTPEIDVTPHDERDEPV